MCVLCVFSIMSINKHDRRQLLISGALIQPPVHLHGALARGLSYCGVEEEGALGSDSCIYTGTAPLAHPLWFFFQAVCCGLGYFLFKNHSVIFRPEFISARVIGQCGFRIHSVVCPSGWWLTSVEMWLMVNVYIESLHGYSHDRFFCCYLIPRLISTLNCIVVAFLSSCFSGWGPLGKHGLPTVLPAKGPKDHCG